MNLKLVAVNIVLVVGIVAFAELPPRLNQAGEGDSASNVDNKVLHDGSSRPGSGSILEMRSRSFGAHRVSPAADAGGYGGCPQTLGSAPVNGLAAGVDVVGMLAYQAAWGSGLRVISLDDPSNPVEIGAFDTPGYSRSVTVDGTAAYVADRDGGLRIIDVTDPAMLSEVGSYDSGGVTNWVAIEHDGMTTIAYLADGPNGLLVLDVSDPAAISVIGSETTAHWADGIVLVNGHALVADHTGGLRIIDVANPFAPSEVAVVDTWPQYETNAVSAFGDFAFLAVGWAGSGGLIVVDVSNPETPVVVSTFDETDEAHGISVSDDGYVFLSDDEKLWIIDVSVPSAPFVIGTHDWPNLAGGDLAGVDVEGELVVEAAERAGRLNVYDRLSCPFFSDGVESSDTSDW